MENFLRDIVMPSKKSPRGSILRPNRALRGELMNARLPQWQIIRPAQDEEPGLRGGEARGGGGLGQTIASSPERRLISMKSITRAAGAKAMQGVR